MSNANGATIANSQVDPIELPPHALLWRVRRLQTGSKGGAPEVVNDADGLPLVLPIAVEIQEFHEAVRRVPARYRLDALDESKKPIGGVPPAYVNLEHFAKSDKPAAPPDPAGELARDAVRLCTDVARDAMRALAETTQCQTDKLDKLVDACAQLVHAVDSAGVSKRPPPVDAPAPAHAHADTHRDDDSAPHEPPWWKPYADEAAKLMPMLVQVLMTKRAAAGAS